jgi:hypothetical protein
MSSVQSIPSASFAAVTARRELPIPAAFTIPRIDQTDHAPAIPEALDIKNIRRANPYADAFGMAVDPSKDISLEGAPGLFARYADQVGNVIDRIYGAEFKALLDIKV